ncbi:MAG: hypothetical protein PHW60_14705 [Kiritimatiellae bacterium]|nr:hypothetical protein [Kiritimatiellia bacterium]
MIATLYAYFGIIGIASILAWMGALAMVVNYARHERRTFFYARAMALALAGLVLAQVNSINVGRIEVDRRQDVKDARERQRSLQRGSTDMLNSKTAGLRFAEDSREDSLDMAGIASSDKRSIYEQAADEDQPASNKKKRRLRWMAQPGEEPSPGVKLLPERDVARANHLDLLNLWMARFVPILVFFLLALDYFLRFNRTVGTILPLPFAGRIVDSLFPKKHSTVFRAGNPGLIAGQIQTIIRKGETFIYFGESRVIRTPAISRVVIPLRYLCRSAAAVLRPNALLQLLERLEQVSVRGRSLQTWRPWSRIKTLLRSGLAMIVKGMKALWRWIAAVFRWMLLPCRWLMCRGQRMPAARPIKAGPAWLARMAPAFSWIRKPAAFVWRLFRNASLRLGQCARWLIEFVRRWGRNIRSGTLEFRPAIILDASSEQDFNQDFIFECAWFNRYCFTVEGLNRSAALLGEFRKFIAERMVPRAAAAKTVNVFWDFPAAMNPGLLRPLAVFSSDVNIKLIVFAADGQIAEIGKWVEEVCPDEGPPHAYPSLLAFLILRMRRITVRFQPWLDRQRQKMKAWRKRVSIERAERAAKAAALKATTPAAKPKAPPEAPAVAGLKAPKKPEAPAPVTQIPGAQASKPEVEIKPVKSVVPAPAPKPVAPMPKPVAEVKAPVPAPVPVKPPPPPPVAMPKVKVSQPQPAPVPAAQPKIKAVQAVVKEPVPVQKPVVMAAKPKVPEAPAPAPKPMPKLEALHPTVKPAVMPVSKAPAVCGVDDFKEIKLKPFKRPGHVILAPKFKITTPPAAASPVLGKPVASKVDPVEGLAAPVRSTAESKPEAPVPPPPPTAAIPGEQPASEPKILPPEPAKTLLAKPPLAAPKEESKQPKTASEIQASSSPIAEVNQAAGVFKFYCSACQQKLAAQIEWQGKTILCPACKAHITIPPLA